MSEGRPSAAIPQASPGRDYERHRAEIDAALRRAVESGWYILGPEVGAFEAEFAGYLGLREGVGVASGTDAVELALRALGIGPGDAVYTVSHTAVATVVAVERTGATPVLVDIDEGTYTMDPASLAAAIEADPRPGGARPAAVVVVHLYGQTAAMAEVMAIARAAGLPVVEDCAQAHGARRDGRTAGTWGDIAAFSFYPTKNLGALGDGGLVATDDAALAARARELRQYGWRDRYVSAVVGVNSRLDEVQAAVLRAKLPHLDEDNARRRVIAARYDAKLGGPAAGSPAAGGPAVDTPAVGPGVEHVYHQYVVRTRRRDELMAALRERGISTAVHYPVPVHLQPAYAGRLPQVVELPITERVAGEIVSLPIFASLTDDEVDRVAGAILEWAEIDPGIAAGSESTL
jgi:dTDP-4-amino-4,6-dideoxygalactose transaminase